MKRWVMVAALLAATGCSSWRLKPGPTSRGAGIAVTSADPATARREALAATLPLFLSSAARLDPSVGGVALENVDDFVGAEKLRPRGVKVVEILLDDLAAWLQGRHQLQPAGFSVGPDAVLVALGDPAGEPSIFDRIASESLSTALFGRGFRAQDSHDPLVDSPRSFRAKSTTDLLAGAERGGWTWVIVGTATATAKDGDGMSNGEARIQGSLFHVGASTFPAAVEVDAHSVGTSTASALSRSLEKAADGMAAVVDGKIAEARAGRSTIAVLIDGSKDVAFVKTVVESLRAIPGVEGAALVQWYGAEDMSVVRVFVVGLKADSLAARLIRRAPNLKIGGVEPEDGRLTLEAPETDSFLDAED